MKIGRFEVAPLNLLLVFVPISVACEFGHAPAAWIFATSALAIVPLAGLMGQATEHLAVRAGAGIGGLLNATFGNAAELIIALMALSKGLTEVVKASITGSIIGNLLLVLGLAVLAGGMKQVRQVFNATAAGLGSTLLALSVVGLLVPAMFHHVAGARAQAVEHSLSLEISAVLLATYVLSLLFQLRTHEHLYSGDGHSDDHEEAWSVRRALTQLLIATTVVAIESEFLVGSVEKTAAAWGMSDVFVGVILLAIIGNAAEHSTAIFMAMKNKMDLSLGIAIGSSTQIALFVAPALVFVGHFAGWPMDLLFTPFEVLAVGISVGVVCLVAQDGESHWMEGVLLLAVYAILGMAFYFLPATAH